MKPHFLILALSVFLSCSSENTINNVIAAKDERSPVPESSVSPSPTVSQNPKCAQSESFCLEIVEDSKREAKNINILSGNKRKWTVELPSPSDYNGYALNWARKNEKGFEISIEYGSKIYFDKVFYFISTGEKFELAEIKVKSFDKAKPENEIVKTDKITPPVAIENFSITDYMND